MADTPRLLVPYIAQSQASKEITHNEGLDTYDILVMANILDRDLSTPPGSPASGDAYIVKATGLSTWAGHDDDIAVYISAQWKFHTPAEGWLLYVQDENLFIYWNGAAWTVMATQGAFTALSDTPASYTGHTLKVVRVNAGETALEFATISTGVADFTDLGDVPASYAGETLKYVRVNAGETALEFAAGTSGAFTDLTDTFASYAGDGQKFIAINAGETGLEAVDAPGGTLGLQRGALVKRTSDLTIATDTPTKIPWQAEIYDTDAMWAVGTPTKTIIPAGVTKAMMVGQIRCAQTVIPNLTVRVLKNNVLVDGLPYVNQPMSSILLSSEEYGVSFAGPPIAVTAADELELEITQDSGGDVDLIAGEHTFFGVILVAPATGGASAFTDLSDVPASYAGHTLKVVRVNAGETALEFATASTGDASTNTSTSVDNEVVLFSSTTGKLLKRASTTGLAVLTSGVLSVVTAPSGTVVGTSDTQTLTNKRITERVVTVSDATSITPAGDTTDICVQANTQGAGTLTINAPTGTPTDAQKLQIRIDCTNIHTFAFNAIYRATTDLPLPTATTGGGKTDYLLFQYHSTDTKWDILAKNFGA